jgi:hypothetical protein
MQQPFAAGQPQPYAAQPVPPTSANAKPPLTTLAKISAGLFFLAALIALIADFAPAVSNSSGDSWNAWNLGSNGSQIASARWLLILAAYSTSLGIIVLRRLRLAEWTFWVRGALGLLYFWQGAIYYSFCKDITLNYSDMSISIAPFLAIFSGIVYLVAAILMIVNHRSKAKI